MNLFYYDNGNPQPVDNNLGQQVTTTSDPNTGDFTFTLPLNLTDDGTQGTYQFTLVADAVNSVGASGYSTPPTTFTIIIGNTTLTDRFPPFTQ